MASTDVEGECEERASEAEKHRQAGQTSLERLGRNEQEERRGRIRGNAGRV